MFTYSRVLTGTLAAALTLSAAGAANAETNKEAAHLQMQTLLDDIVAARNGNAEASAISGLQSQLDQLSSSLGGDLPCAVGAGSGNAVAGVPVTVPTGCVADTPSFSNTTAVAIPTGPAVVTSTITVSGAQTYLWDVDLTTFITHTFSADLDITLQSPAGTVVTITTDNGAGNDNVFNGTRWDDSANPTGQVPYSTNDGVVTDSAYVNLTTQVTLTPEEALSAFAGENPNGDWIITISDDLAGDGGSLDSWSLQLTTLATAPITNPTQSFTQSTATATVDAGVATSTLAVSGVTAPICKVTLQTQLEHTFSADLDVTLTSPAGTVVTLTTDNGAGNDNVFAGTLWDDDANPAGQVPYTTNDGLVTDHAYVNLTTAATLVPEENLGAFRGQDANGTWTITLSDDLAGDSGQLANWTLNVTSCSCPQADIAVTLTDAPDPIVTGGTLTYTVGMTNLGIGAATDMAFDLALPAQVAFESVSSAGATCTTPAVGSTGNVVCTWVGSTPEGASHSPTVNVTVPFGITAGTSLTASVTATAVGSDPVTANNSASGSTVVRLPFVAPDVIPAMDIRAMLALIAALAVLAAVVIHRK